MQASFTTKRSDERQQRRFGTEYRADLQGLRALAVVLVLLFHAGVPLLRGGFVGVDVFFVLSGFLITGIVAREISATGKISLTNFYARRVLRIVPAATVVLVATALATMLWLPVTRWAAIAKETIGSSLYVSNWQFARSTDYLNAAEPPSPLQHFWSLAIEEQYYLLWPALLAIGCWVIARRIGGNVPPQGVIRFAIILMMTITIVSFIASIIAMETASAAAYFVTHSRLWELGIGSLLALAAPALGGLSLPVLRTFFYLGLALILFAGVTFNEATPFPGPTALVPVLGAAFVIVGGLGSASTKRSHALLGNRVAVWVGNLSYALYLWHWPILVIGQQAFGLKGLTNGLLLVGLSFLPAFLSTHLLEKPISRSSALRNSSKGALRIGACGIVLSLICGLALLASPALTGPPPGHFSPSTMGAATIRSQTLPTPVDRLPRDLFPSLVAAKEDIPRVYEEGCHLEVERSTPKECAFGADDGRTVLLTGDSHAAQWFSALEKYAQERGLRLVTMTKSSCPFISVPIELTGSDVQYSECVEWNENVRNYIEETRPAAVVTRGLMRVEVTSTWLVSAGLEG